jgi:hypothetical protein
VKLVPGSGGLRATLPVGSLYRVVGPGTAWGDASAGVTVVACNGPGAGDPDARVWELLCCHLEPVAEPAGGTLFD